MSKFYFLVMDGVVIQANEGDTIHELAVAETILDYLKTVCPEHDFDIAEAVFAEKNRAVERELKAEDDLFNSELARLGFGVMVWSGE